MCVQVYNKDTKAYAGTPYEFADMLSIPISALPVDNAYNQLIPENCLCQVDIEKACKLAGYNYTENSDFEPVISKKTQEEILKSIRTSK
jgi:hypothetical protein